MQSIGYDNRNFLVAMGTVSFVMILLLIRVIVASFVKLFLFASQKKFGGIKFYRFIVKNLFFNIFLQLAFEVFIEIIIKAYLNI